MVKINGRTPERGDILRLEFNPRTGSEQAGFRPAIVISPAAYNRISTRILVCPITSRQQGWPFEVKLPNQLQTHGVVLVDQLKAVDCHVRGARFVETVSVELMNEILARLETLIS
ncbi:MAG: mRNA-degrading endonuclease [Symploca sp. SIO2G7]|nr:mRNA-degrading endonuclease [Symploca sp. SIO2G7]